MTQDRCKCSNLGKIINVNWSLRWPSSPPPHQLAFLPLEKQLRKKALGSWMARLRWALMAIRIYSGAMRPIFCTGARKRHPTRTGRLGHSQGCPHTEIFVILCPCSKNGHFRHSTTHRQSHSHTHGLTLSHTHSVQEIFSHLMVDLIFGAGKKSRGAKSSE